jgi:hypothetical protein
MAEKPPPFTNDVLSAQLEVLFDQMLASSATIDANRWTSLVVDLAILTMLIDAEIVTIDQAIQRIMHIHGVLPAPYEKADTSTWIKFIVQWLQRQQEHREKQQRPPWQPVVIEGDRDLDYQVDDGEPPEK